MNPIQDNDTLLLQQAARWFIWLHEHKVNPARMEVFQRWCSNSQSHRVAYEKIESLWRSCDGIDVFDMPWPTAAELQVDTYDGSYSLPLPERKNPLLDDWRLPASESAHLTTGEFVLGQIRKPKQTPGVLSRKWLKPAAVAACLAAFALTVTASRIYEQLFVQPAINYATEVGELQRKLLEDGSVLTLGASSRVSVKFTQSTREVVLERGEAFFEVAKDAGRPFVVSVGAGQVQALGTAFNINKRNDSVTVSVVEGLVKVTRNLNVADEVQASKNTGDIEPLQETRLEPGQQLIYAPAGQWQAIRNGKLPERATAWREGRLAYVNERLGAVLQDVNRYTRHKLVLGDKSLAELTYTGTVFSGDIREWVQGLQQAFPIKVIETDKQIVLLKS